VSTPSHQHDDDRGVWCEIFSGDYKHRPALFLDRDGVLIEDSHYLARAQDMRMLAGVAGALARCNRLGIPVVLVTNQSGIARGLYAWEGFHAVQAALSAELAQADAHVDAVLACAHHVDGNAPLNVADHHWRKPNPGMILAAAERMKLDLPRSWIVGDRASDLAAGRAAGLKGGILLVATERGSEYAAASALRSPGFAVETSASLADAVSLLLERELLRAGADRRAS
jgi:D-glycero-D-manno-heptose 1,7-bisphosphate phosphatase